MDRLTSFWLFVILFSIAIAIFDLSCVKAHSQWLNQWNQNQYQQNAWSNFRFNDQKITTTPWPALGPHRGATIYRSYWSSGIYEQRSNSSLGNSRSGQTLQANTGNAAEINDNDLREFSENLLKEDVNNAAKYVTVQYQGKTMSRSTKDEAPLPLLIISTDAYSIPTIQKLMRLHDNYVPNTNVHEDNTPDERNEEEQFLEAIINTPVVEFTRNFLISKGKIPQDQTSFKNILRDIWFTIYRRGGRGVGSSGFEHVFLTEIKNNQISGLHNWIYFNEEEKKERANYLGYLHKIEFGHKGAIIKYHFNFEGIDKPVGSMFIGTSPEFELSLYTTCFLTRPDRVCPLKLGDKRFVIRTFTYRYKGKNLIGSAFPEI